MLEAFATSRNLDNYEITEYYLKVGNWPHMPSDCILVSALIFLIVYAYHIIS